MDDKKYNILKARLEALDYKFPFTHESMPLIESILTDLSTLYQKLKKSKKSEDSSSSTLTQRIEHLIREKEKLEQELQSSFQKATLDKNELLSLISGLKSENQTLNKKIAAWQGGKINEPDLRSHEYIEKLLEDCNNLRVSLEESRNQSQKLSIDNQNLLEKNRLIEQQNSNLKEEVEISTKRIKEITSENKLKIEEFFILKQTISSNESKQVLMQNELNRLKLELQKTQTQCQYLEKSLLEHSKESLILRTEVESHNSVKIRKNSTIENLQKQVEVLTSEKHKLLNLAEERKTNMQELEVKIKDLEILNSEYCEKLAKIMKENYFFTESLKEKNDELKNKDTHARLIEREMEAYKVYVKKHEESRKENKKLTEKNESLLVELRTTREELGETKGMFRTKEEDSRQFKTLLDYANTDIEQLKRNLEEESFKSDSVKSMKKNTGFLEEQLAAAQRQFEDSLSRETQLHREVEQLRRSLQKAEEKLAYASKQAEYNITQKLLIEADNTKLLRNLNEYIQRENNKNLEISKLEHKNQGLHSEVEGLKIETRRLLDEKDGISQQLNDLESSFLAEQGHVNSLNEQVAQLNGFISTLEVSRKESAEKIENLQVDLLDKENLVKSLKEDISQAKQKIALSEKMKNDWVQSQDSLLKQTESLKSELDLKLGELSRLKSCLKNAMNEIEDLKNRTEAQHESESLLNKTINELEIEKFKLEEQSKSLNQRKDEKQKKNDRLKSKISELSARLLNLTRESKRYQDRARSLELEGQTLLRKLEESNRDLKNSQEVISDLSRENADLNLRYKTSLENLDRVSRSYDLLHVDFKKISAKTQSAENMAEDFKKQEKIWLKNLSEIEEQLKGALKTAEISEIKRLEAEKNLEDVQRESQRVFVRDFDLMNEDIYQQLSLTEGQKSFYETRLKTAENEIVLLRNQLETEKGRTGSIGKNTKNLDENRNKAFQESDSLVSDLYRQIEAYKCDSLKLEMDYLRLMDDHTKSKKLLKQAEEKILILERRC